ncbi:30S ribosomal protein S1 [Blattabacterium cuenoti]|uniref:30S ribosomal protein S1 n=1 Tax=Blattabacterium sp. (Chorisoserrata sp.) TaxID=2712796 RepID=A0A6G6BSY2_9FLAO|nr:30S ribosomal protein S1 [Blattabacterium cuenoti]QID55113.1 30S ribosomal protein S1 [Blattabacterium sp. (Chorisoserrata sp.)]
MSNQNEKIITQQTSHHHFNESIKETDDLETNFDWTKYDESFIRQEREQKRKKYEEIYVKTLPDVQELEIYGGKIISIHTKTVLVDFGFKAEGIIPMSEFKENLSIKVGDHLEVMVEKIDYKGQCLLSYQKAKMLRNWEKINNAYNNSEVILGYVSARTKGGLIVEVFEIECFLPGSHINVKPVRDYDTYVGKTMEIKVVKINQKTKNVVVSHKVLIEKDIEEQKKEMISKLDKGQVLEGKIKNILPYGAFVDLGGVDALLHITDMSWPHINHPTEVVQLEQQLKFVVLGVDKEKNRIQLGLKQLQPHPWDSLDNALKIGSKVNGKVSVLADYGAFIEIIPGVEALLHISEMSWSSDLSSTKDFVKVGDKIEAMILTIDRKERKMSLSMRQLTQDPWKDIHNKYSVGSKHFGTVKKFTNFGVVVELEEGIYGILYTHDFSWTKKIKHPSEFCNINSKLEVVVLSLDSQTRRLILGHKQLKENPWKKYESIYFIGSIHKGQISNIFDKGAHVQFVDNHFLDAFVPMRFLEKKDGTFLKKGETSSFRVLEFNKDNKKIIISHTSTYRDKEHKKDQRVRNRKFERSTLGDLEGLVRLKEKIEKEKNK